MSPDGDPYRFAEMLYQLVVRAEHGRKVPLFLPTGEDALEKLQERLRRMDRVLVDAAPWSAGLKKGNDMAKAKL